ncbi:hypothetical protein AB0B31_11000 [Catellatospora citrea]|uniref:hypothetical protein n=1 Tax=Catellatospora citrea TaxID=53366 RepID=UPI0033E32888
MTDTINRQDVVLEYLAANGPATAKTISAATTIAYSTLTPVLRQLAASQKIAKTGDTWATAHAQPADVETAEAAPSAVDEQLDSEDGTGHVEHADDPVGADQPVAVEQPVAVDRPDIDDADPIAEAGAPATDVGPDPVPVSAPADADDAAQARDDGQEQNAEQDQAMQAAEPTGNAAKRRYNRSDVPALAKGELRQAVEAYLHSVPDQQLTVPQISARVGQQLDRKVGGGAVQNAVLKLVELGTAVHLPGKPNKYQAAVTE